MAQGGSRTCGSGAGAGLGARGVVRAETDRRRTSPLGGGVTVHCGVWRSDGTRPSRWGVWLEPQGWSQGIPSGSESPRGGVTVWTCSTHQAPWGGFWVQR